MPTRKTPKQTSDADAADIIVTTQFRSQKLQDTPLPITALTAETIKQRNQVNVADIAGNDKCYYLNIEDTYPGIGPTRAPPARPRTMFMSVKRTF